MREEVILEYIDEDRVSVIPFDRVTNTMISNSGEVMNPYDVRQYYDVIGEVKDGEILLFSEEDELIEEVYDEAFDIDEEC